MSDGCSGVLDWLPFVGGMSDCCKEHDRAFHYGGTEKDWRAANKAFYNCIHKKKRCWLCHQVSKIVAWERRFGVRAFGRSAFNWLGPGLPSEDRRRGTLEALAAGVGAKEEPTRTEEPENGLQIT